MGYIGIVPLVSGLWLFGRIRESLSVNKISAAQFERNLWWTHQGFRLVAHLLIAVGIVMLFIGLRGTHP